MDFELLPSQYSLLTSNASVSALVAGIGYGKSYSLAHFVLQQINDYPEAQGLVVANTYSQLSNATIPAITSLLDDLGIKYNLVMSGAQKRLEVNQTKILIYSLENYEAIRGIEVGWIAVDEAAFASREAIDVIFGRLRDKNGSLKARFFTSPNGFNWFYDYVTESKVEIHRGKTSDNKNLPESYYQNLLKLYGGPDSPLARQELFGEFVNQTSKAVYYAFDRNKNVAKIQENKSLPVYVGCDFNAGNMNYVVVQWTPTGFNVIKAVTLKDHVANTFQMASEIYKDFGSRAIVIPDSTANSRKTSAEAGVTDISILKNIGLKVEYTKNPRIKDRWNTVNLHFFTGKIKVDESCVSLIKELETLGSDQDEGSVAHLSVAMGYVCWKLSPIQGPQSKSETLENPFLNRK